MTEVDTMNDAELRSKLMEFGFPVMPITGSTRKTMVKKLKMLIDNQGKVNKDNRRSLGRYSSEDESDTELKTARDNKYRRQTMAAPVMQPPVVKKRPVRAEPLDLPPPLVKEVQSSTRTTRTTKILERAARHNDEFDTGSESDEVAEKFNSFRGESPKKTPSPGRVPQSFLSASSAADAASDRINQIRSRLSQYNSVYDQKGASPDSARGPDTPFLSNFTKRLSQLSESPKNSFDYKNDIIKENDVNGGSSPRPYLNNYRPRGRLDGSDYKASKQSIFQNNYVPFLVIIVAVLFFIVIAILYLGLRSNSSLDVAAKVPHCIRDNINSRKFVNCVTEEDTKPAFHLLQVLKPELVKLAVRHKCESHRIKPYMTEKDIIDFVVEFYAIKNGDRVARDLNNLKVLILANPVWGIKILQLDNEDEIFKEENIVEKLEDISHTAKHSKILALILDNPPISWRCYFSNVIWSFLNIFTSILGGVLILYVGMYGVKYCKERRQKEQDEEVTMVENIIEILQNNASESSDNYMVINHVRDMLLSISDRKRKGKIWEKAVRYIAENESRIRTEVQVVNGEPSEVWRWLGGSKLNTSSDKTWQGQAFETQVGSVNSLPCSPTPCLKIRGMVEDGDSNIVAIKKAVLSKCAKDCRILHCGVETSSSCVYLKCADTSDAAVAYRNLHGWWYAGNLVTVKYLRLERYMQRFPDSAVKGPPYLQ